MVRQFPRAVTLFGSVFLIALFVFMISPLVVIAATSLTASDFLVFPPQGLSLKWYARAFETSSYVNAAWTSIRLGLTVMIAAVVLGGGAAIAINYMRGPVGATLSVFFLSPLVLPTIIIGIGLVLVFSRYANGPSMVGLWLGHTVITIPYVVRTTLAVLASSDRSLEEAARTMGASSSQVLWHVTLPKARTGLITGGFFAFSISFDEAVIALFMRSPGIETLPIRIYGDLEYSPSPTVAAVATLMICVTLVTVMTTGRAAQGLGRAT